MMWINGSRCDKELNGEGHTLRLDVDLLQMLLSEILHTTYIVGSVCLREASLHKDRRVQDQLSKVGKSACKELGVAERHLDYLVSQVSISEDIQSLMETFVAQEVLSEEKDALGDKLYRMRALVGNADFISLLQQNFENIHQILWDKFIFEGFLLAGDFVRYREAARLTTWSKVRALTRNIIEPILFAIQGAEDVIYPAGKDEFCVVFPNDISIALKQTLRIEAEVNNAYIAANIPPLQILPLQMCLVCGRILYLPGVLFPEESLDKAIDLMRKGREEKISRYCQVLICKDTFNRAKEAGLEHLEIFREDEECHYFELQR